MLPSLLRAMRMHRELAQQLEEARAAADRQQTTLQQRLRQEQQRSAAGEQAAQEAAQQAHQQRAARQRAEAHAEQLEDQLAGMQRRVAAVGMGGGADSDLAEVSDSHGPDCMFCIGLVFVTAPLGWGHVPGSGPVCCAVPALLQAQVELHALRHALVAQTQQLQAHVRQLQEQLLECERLHAAAMQERADETASLRWVGG